MSHFCCVDFNSMKCSRNATVDSGIAFVSLSDYVFSKRRVFNMEGKDTE